MGLEAGLAVLIDEKHRENNANMSNGRQKDQSSEQTAMAGEESSGWPTAYVVPGVDVRSVVVVHPDGNKVLSDNLLNVGVGIGSLVHNVAPVTPHSRDGQQNGFIFFLGLGKRSRPPGLPVNQMRVVGVRGETELGQWGRLCEIATPFVDETLVR